MGGLSDKLSQEQVSFREFRFYPVDIKVTRLYNIFHASACDVMEC
jgi:hypothetical protein